jgi:hypothetical protein
MASLKAQQRNHNEWFMPLARKAKHCPCCHSIEPQQSGLYAWDQYVYGKWKTITHFCQACFETHILSQLKDHTGTCGCTVTFCTRSGYSMPEWFVKAKEAKWY